MPSLPTKTHPRRFVLPTVCAALAVSSSLWGEYVLVEQANHRTVGPLVAAEAAVLVSVAFIALAVITLLLAIFPGTEQPREAPLEENDAALALIDLDEAEADERTADERDANEQSAPVSRGRSADDIITALKKSATKQANARLAAEARAEVAVARTAELETQMASFRDGTAPEVMALKAQYREESNRDALRKVNELGQASERLAQALKEGKARVEADLATREDELRELRESLPVLRSEMAADEYHRIRIALNAINDTPVGDLNERQRSAVAAHVARLDEVLERLAPDTEVSFSPNAVSLPPLTVAATPKALSDDQPAGKKKRSPLLRRNR